jgi:hypothetical protein
MESYKVSMIALAHGIPESEVVPMLVRWKQGGLTYAQIQERLASPAEGTAKPVEVSAQRLAELILEGMGPERPTPRQPREAKPA